MHKEAFAFSKSIALTHYFEGKIAIKHVVYKYE